MRELGHVIRAAYFCEFPTLLGGERSLLTFLAHRETAGVVPIVLAPAAGPLSRALDAMSVPSVPWSRPRRGAASLPAEQLASFGVDLVHANSLMTADAALEAATIFDVPAIAHVRDIMNLSPARCKRLMRMSAILAVSDAVAIALRVQGISADRIHRVYNGVDGAALRRSAQPGKLRSQLGMDAAPLIGCIGQFSLRKGQAHFLEAAARLVAHLPQAVFVLAGERYSQKLESVEFEESLRLAAASPTLAGKVHFLGYRDDIANVLADLNVLVVPSLQEPLSRALLEAMAMGVATIATDVGGSSEILDNGRCGLLTPAGDAAALACAMERLLTQRQLRETLIGRAKRRVASLFAPQRHALLVRRCYEYVLS